MTTLKRTRRLACATALYVAAGVFFFSSSANATPVTWQLDNVTFDIGFPVQGGQEGSVVATGSFVYDDDLGQFLTWQIAVSGAADPTVDFTFTPATSFIPSVYVGAPPGGQIQFIRTLPGNPPENPFGNDPVDSNSVLIALDFFESPGNAGLTDAGGTIPIVTGFSQVNQLYSHTGYYVRTGCVTTVTGVADLCPAFEPTPPELTPEPSGLILVGGGLALLGFAARRTAQPRP